MADSEDVTFALDGAAYRGHLEALLDTLPDATTAVLARTDGFELASVTRSTISPSRLSAVASSMLALGQASLRETRLGTSDNLLIEGSAGKLLLMSVSGERVLAIVAGESTVSGKLLWAARACAAELARLA